MGNIQTSALAAAFGVAARRIEADGNTVAFAVLAGSHAHGVARPDSDLDVRCVHVAPLERFVGLERPVETYDLADPDVVSYEAGKFCALALAANPTILEMLAADTPVLHCGPFGEALREHREAFLSNLARKTYGGYAMQQFRRYQQRGDGSFSADTRKRTVKHARHLFRLLEQGEHLLATGELRARIGDVERIVALSELPADRMVAEAEAAFGRFDRVESVLPDEPDTERIHRLLVAHRLGRF